MILHPKIALKSQLPFLKIIIRVVLKIYPHKQNVLTTTQIDAVIILIVFRYKFFL